MTVTCDDDDIDVFKTAMIVAVNVLVDLLIIVNVVVCCIYCKKRGLFKRKPISEDCARLEEFNKSVE